MKIAIIGCGEVGGAYGRALNGKATLLLCDIVPDGRPGALAQELGLELHAAPGDWLRDCDVVMAAVPGRESVVAAQSALPYLSQGSVYVDVTTGPPALLKQSCQDFEAKGRSFVDTAILGAVALTGSTTPVLIAGEDAERARDVYGLMGAEARILEDGIPGDAVALKLLRSVVIKNIECAAVECLTAAEELGVREKLFEMFDDVDARSFTDLLTSLTKSHIVHAERRMHEMEDSAAQLKALGFDAAVTGALKQRYATTLAEREKNPPSDDTPADLATALAWLTKSCRTSG